MIKRTLYFGNPAYLKKSDNQLVIDQPGNLRDLGRKVSRHVPIEDVGIVILDHPQITITQSLLTALMNNNGLIINCNEQHLPGSMMMSLTANDTHTSVLRAQVETSLPLKKNLWQQTVVAKISNQAVLLEHCGQPFLPLIRWSSEVKSGDTTNMEGRAAAYYWSHLFGREMEFYREKGGKGINAALNYGYAILRSVVARAVVSSGLHPALGIFHKNKYNAFCLADDLMEPYRPYVDSLVRDIWIQNPEFEELDKEIKKQLLMIPTMDIIIEGKASPLMVGISRTTASFVKCLRGETRRLLFPQLAVKVK